MLEYIEPRLLLSGAPPLVASVYLSGSAWGAGFRQYLDDHVGGSADYGYGTLVAASTRRLAGVLPWSNVDRVSIGFSSNVAVEARHLRVYGVTVPEYAVASVAYDDGFAMTATFTLARPLANDQVLLVLDGGEGGVGQRETHVLMDGDSDGAAGGDFRFRLGALPGDVGGDNVVNASDLGSVRARQTRSVASPGEVPFQYSPFCDVNGDGRVNAVDLGLVRARQLNRLPGEEPAPAATAAALTLSPATKGLFSAVAILA